MHATNVVVNGRVTNVVRQPPPTQSVVKRKKGQHGFLLAPLTKKKIRLRWPRLTGSQMFVSVCKLTQRATGAALASRQVHGGGAPWRAMSSIVQVMRGPSLPAWVLVLVLVLVRVPVRAPA